MYSRDFAKDLMLNSVLVAVILTKNLVELRLIPNTTQNIP